MIAAQKRYFSGNFSPKLLSTLTILEWQTPRRRLSAGTFDMESRSRHIFASPAVLPSHLAEPPHFSVLVSRDFALQTILTFQLDFMWEHWRCNSRVPVNEYEATAKILDLVKDGPLRPPRQISLDSAARGEACDNEHQCGCNQP